MTAQKPLRNGPPRVKMPERGQITMRMASLDDQLAPDHQARSIWEYVAKQDLGPLYAKVKAGSGIAGRSAHNPHVLLALWLYAVVDAVSSARHLAELCSEHIAYQWLCGGESPNAHTLSDFRVKQDGLVDRLLSESVARLRHVGLVTLEMVAQDGMRVRASAGSGSFHRIDTLEKMREEAQARVAALKAEADANPAASRTRKRAAQERAARERLERLDAALAEVEKVAAIPGKRREEIRVSTTDPQARLMKMADGGFRPAYNVQFATDTSSQVIVGVDAVNAGTDRGQASPMRDQVDDRYGNGPGTMLVDGGFVSLEAIDRLDRAGTVIVAPVPLPQDPRRDPHQPLPTDSPAVAQWRQRMGDPAIKILYHLRAATAECVNAIARNRGLRQMTVRGTQKAGAIARWFALAHNVVRHATLTSQSLPA